MENQDIMDNSKRWTMTAVLTVAIAGLVGLALAVVLVIQISVGRHATTELFRAKGDLMVDLIASRVREQLDPASAQLSFIAELLAEVGTNYSRRRIADIITGSLAAAPQINRIVFLYPDAKAIVVERTGDTPTVTYPDLSGNPNVRESLQEAETSTGARWGEFIFVNSLGGPAVNRRHAVWRDGKFIGALAALVPLRQLSVIVEQSAAGEYGGTPFILYGDESVLAHRRLMQPFPGLSPDHPLPTLAELGDPVLAQIWSGRTAAPLLAQSDRVRAVEIGGQAFLFLHTQLTEFGKVPWNVGAYFKVQDFAEDIRAMFFAGLAGLVVLAFALGSAVVLARRLARPTRRFARAAAHLAELDFERAEHLSRSRIRELDDQAVAFNRLVSALRWFEAYVPRRLVRQLARSAGQGGIASTTREVTIMFTDIVGFTARSQTMTPEKTAEMLNRHFAHVIAAIESTGGTVDKFMGDGVMAFWGAPDLHAAHARAALDSARAIARSTPNDGLRMRVGVHTGTVVAGNVGTRERLNYTILGDAVNVTQRIEELGHALMEDSERCCVLTSRQTHQAAGAPADFVRAGEFTLRGRGDPVEIYRLALHVDAPQAR
ncbi:MAG: HAMP domain-containing protein [Alphaproteobacteria bacterium]|nr:HAMP domain-containing protein [Alphaproteobacteria bacterium]